MNFMATDGMGVLPLWRRAREFGERVWRLGQRAPRRLRLCESLPLGDRRFLAVVEFEAERFLVGGTASSVVLLSRLAGRGRKAGQGEDGPAEEIREEETPEEVPHGQSKGCEKC